MDNQKITTKSKFYFKTLDSIKEHEINKDVEAAIKYTKNLHERQCFAGQFNSFFNK